jgi:hypothetical protein
MAVLYRSSVIYLYTVKWLELVSLIFLTVCLCIFSGTKEIEGAGQHICSIFVMIGAFTVILDRNIIALNLRFKLLSLKCWSRINYLTCNVYKRRLYHARPFTGYFFIWWLIHLIYFGVFFMIFLASPTTVLYHWFILIMAVYPLIHFMIRIIIFVIFYFSACGKINAAECLLENGDGSSNIDLVNEKYLQTIIHHDYIRNEIENPPEKRE